MDPVNLPVAGIPGRDAQCNPPVIKLQYMLESIADILRLLVGHCINISIADIVEALPGLLYALDLDFAKVIRKLLVISIREISDIDVEIGFSLILFFHKLFPRYNLIQDTIISYESFQKRIGELTFDDITAQYTEKTRKYTTHLIRVAIGRLPAPRSKKTVIEHSYRIIHYQA
jgi:hypothetical protein